MKSIQDRVFIIFSLVIIIFSALGCEVTAEKIDRWKKTIKGPSKLRAAVRDENVSVDLRVRAADALIDISLPHLLKDLHFIKDGKADAVKTKLADKLVTQMNGASEQETTKVQMRAKDALFTLRPAFSADLRQKTDLKLAKWIATDWSVRAGGDHAAEKIFKTIGKSAAPILVDKISANPTFLLSFVTLLKTIGTKDDLKQAAEKATIIAANEKKKNEKTFEALALLEQEHSRKLLQQIAIKGKEALRKWAIRALRLDPDISNISLMVSIINNPKEIGDLKEAAFDALEAIKDLKTQEAIAEIIKTHRDSDVRFRAMEAIAQCCGAKGIKAALESFPTSEKYKENDVSDFIEKDIKKVGKRALPVMRELIRSKSWLARVIAARIIGALGTNKDLEILKKIENDQAKLKGWGKRATVGSEVKAAMKKLGS